MIFESCYFLAEKAKVALLNWVQRGGIKIVDVPVTAYSEIAQSIENKLPTTSLIWLANSYQQQQILTVDRNDFSAFRLKNHQWFQLLEWY